jgi:pimeloyl-ACP methyl ester carboxylesterase
VAGDLEFNFVDLGHGTPFVFQHGLGRDLRQATGLFSPQPGVRLLSFDARGHGQTPGAADRETLTFDTFGNDLVALLDHLGIGSAVVGGVSLGAAVALNVAVRYPERVAGLVLVRPAWLDGPMLPGAVALFDKLAHLLRQHGPRAASRLELDATFRVVAARFPETAESLRRQLQAPRAIESVARLEHLPRQRPIARLRDAAAIRVPTVVLAHQLDPLHPHEYGVALAQTIPGARLAHLTPKTVARERHAAEVQSEIAWFLESYRQQKAVAA